MDALSIAKRLAGGYLIGELTAALEAVAAEVVESGNPGKVSISFAVKPVGKDRGDPRVIVEESIDRKPPTRPVRGSIFYAYQGELHVDDPRQVRMDFRAVTDQPADIRETDDAPAPVREA